MTLELRNKMDRLTSKKAISEDTQCWEGGPGCPMLSPKGGGETLIDQWHLSTPDSTPNKYFIRARSLASFKIDNKCGRHKRERKSIRWLAVRCGWLLESAQDFSVS